MMVVEKETQFEAWLEENMPEPGGNPNYVETVTGTLANPWGDVSYSELLDAVNNNNATCKLAVDATAIDFGIIPMIVSSGGSFLYSELVAYASNAVSGWVALVANYSGTGVLETAYALRDGTAISLLPFSSSPTTLTIVHHPLPEN